MTTLEHIKPSTAPQIKVRTTNRSHMSPLEEREHREEVCGCGGSASGVRVC